MSQIIGAGTGVFFGPTGASPTFVEVVGASDVNFPETVVTDVKNTNYKTPNKTHDYIPGWQEAGQMEVTTDYLPATETQLRGIVGVRKSWKVVLSDGANFIFEGYVNKVGEKVPNEDKVTQNFGVKCCTVPVYSPT
jgi:hypothetical protein